jgi:competence protein ComEA
LVLSMGATLIVVGPDARVSAGGKDVSGVVNLNTAGPGLLVLLPGVGAAKAERIVVYRARHPFRTVDELVRIKGIGRRMVRTLRPHLAVAGPSTVRASPRDARDDPSTVAAAPASGAVPERPPGGPGPSRTTPDTGRPPITARSNRGTAPPRPARLGPPRPVRSSANHCASPR